MRLGYLRDVDWVEPPPTNSGILGIYKDPSIIPLSLVITISGWGPNLRCRAEMSRSGA